MRIIFISIILLICLLFSVITPISFDAYGAENNWVDWDKSFDNHEIYNVIYGNGIYVAVGADGIINVSKDCNDWFIADSNKSLLNSVAFGDNCFVAVGSKGKIYYSKDGLTWTIVSSGTDKDLKSIAWNNNLYVVVGNNGTILISSDGLNWRNVSTEINYSFNNITAGSGKFIATVSDSFNTILITDNGSSWKSIEPYPNLYGYNNLIYNGKFYLMWANLANNYGYTALKSYDGVNWSKTNSAPNIKSITFDGDRLIGIDGNLSQDQSQYIYTSYDGEYWVKNNININFKTFNSLRNIYYLGSKFIGIDYYSNIYNSTDSVIWKKENSVIDYNYSKIEPYNNKLAYYDDKGNIYTSMDGVDWTKLSKYLYFEKPIKKLLFSGEKMLAISGMDSSLYSSVDGNNFIKQNITGIDDINLFECNGRYLIVAGNSIYFSNDFIAWEKLTKSNEELRAKDIAFNGKNYVAVGGKDLIVGGENNQSRQYRVLSSSYDLKTWNVHKALDATAMNSIVWAVDKFVAVGNSGDIIYSFDGSTWHDAKSTTKNSLYDIIWDGNYYVASGEKGTIMYSKDGINWINYRSLTNDTLTKLLWTGENYLAVGTNTILFGNKTDVPTPLFIDTIDNWAEEIIYDALDLNLIKGVDQNHFNPNKSITRAEFSAIIVRALNLRPNEKSNHSFNDVKLSDWFYKEITAAYDNNILTGYGGGLIKPNNYITREEAMVIIERAMKHIGTTGTSDNPTSETNNYLSIFKDYVKISYWATNAASKCIKYNVFNGSNGYLRPKDNITRAETAKIILMTILK